MNEYVNIKKALSSKKIEVPFSILKEIAAVYSKNSLEGQELVIRALDCKEKFTGYENVLNSLVRETGLFPYISKDYEQLSLPEKIAYYCHLAPEKAGKHFVFHREQLRVFNALLSGISIILSAPTSFGKSLIIDALIASEIFRNIVIIVPTIALIDETRRRLTSKFSSIYQVITHISFALPREKNIYILTQERYLSGDIEQVDFFIIDEFYKLSSNSGDGDRSDLLNLALDSLLQKTKHFYFLGPSIRKLSKETRDKLLSSKIKHEFLEINYPTVACNFHDYSSLDTKDKSIKKNELCQEIIDRNEQALMFCSSPQKVGKEALNLNFNGNHAVSKQLNNLVQWLEKNYHRDWTFIKGLKYKTGQHHGVLPRAIAQYLVDLFNRKELNFLVCTSTLIEGVNTSARHMIIWDKKIARNDYDLFTFNNIVGRAGRMFEHFIGEVYLFNEKPDDNNREVDIPLFDQDKASQNLLFDLDPQSLTQDSEKKVKNFDTGLLSKEILNKIRTDKQKAVVYAERLYSNQQFLDHFKNLADPYKAEYKSIEFVCNEIWEHLAINPTSIASGSVTTYKQLSWYIQNLRDGIKSFIDNQKSHDSIEDRITKALRFKKNWAEHHFPNFVRTINLVQNHLFPDINLDLEPFANAVENFFQHPFLVALEEYGLPLEVGIKIKNYILSEENFQETLENLKNLNSDNLSLESFESDVIHFAQRGLEDKIYE